MAPRSTGKQAKQAVAEKDQEEQGETKVKGSLEQIVKQLIKKGKERGFVTYDEVNAAIPAEEFSSEQIEDAMTAITDGGVQLAEGESEAEEAEPAEKPGKEAESEYEAGGNIDDDDTGRTDDPVRMYLREMGSVELLSREGRDRDCQAY